MANRGLTVWLFAMTGLLVLSGCNSANRDNAKTPPAASASPDIDPSQPITITAYRVSAGMTENEFNQFIVEPVKKRYPNVTINYMEAGNGTQPQDLVVTGQIPDLLITDQGGLRTFTDLQLLQDLTPFIKKYNMDVSKFDPVPIQIAKGFSTKDQLIAIPFSLNFSGFFYNKDVFEKFAVPYPKDGMDWNDIIELGKRLARAEGWGSYKAIYPNPVKSVAFDNGVDVVNPKTNRADFLSEDWKQVFQTYVDILKIPGNMTVPTPNKLFETGQLAMLSSGVARIGDFDKLYKEGTPVNWDVIAHPKITKYKSTGLGSVSPAYLMISPTSKNKDAVFKVIASITEKENQLNMTRQGRLSALNDPQVRNSFGQGLESTKGKNLKGMLALPFSGYVQYTTYDNMAAKYLNSAAVEVATGTKDVNTALREAQELANKDIAAALQ